MDKYINLIKLSVGTETPETLEEWQASPKAQSNDGFPRHITRMWPKRRTEILNGGSIYWVIKGAIQARQKIIRFDEVIGQDGIRRCAIVFKAELIRTTFSIRRPFQGWRYLNPEDAPNDLPKRRKKEDKLPKDLALALADIGLL